MNDRVYHRKLAKVLDQMGGLYTPQDILHLIAIGKMQSFVEGQTWGITQVALYPRTKALELVAVVGDLKDIDGLQDQVIGFAESIGASVIMAYGRTGWLKHGLKRGWKVKGRNYVYCKDM